MRKISDYRVEFSGLENRLYQIVNPNSERTVMTALDHGYFHGAPRGLVNLKKTMDLLLPYSDCISLCIGGLKCLDNKTKVPIILRATGGTAWRK